MKLVHDEAERRAFARDAIWRARRDAALARDDYRCSARDGEHRGPLSVHHRVPLRQHGDPYALENLVSLCRRHHEEAEALTRRLALEIELPQFAYMRQRIAVAAQRAGKYPLDWIAELILAAVDDSERAVNSRIEEAA